MENVSLTVVYPFISHAITYGAFTLTETETETETDKMATIPNGISVSEQYERLHTFLCKPSFIGLSICLGLCVNAPLEHSASYLIFMAFVSW